MKEYFMWMIIVSTTFCAIWYVISCWLMSFSHDHDWLSSFVEIAFALNGAITFEKIRGYIMPFHEVFNKKLKVVEKKYEGCKQQEDVLNYVKAHIPMVFVRLEEKSGEMSKWTVNFARLGCFACIVTLLVYSEGSNVTYVPILVFPCIFYCVGNMFLIVTITADILGLFEEALKFNNPDYTIRMGL